MRRGGGKGGGRRKDGNDIILQVWKAAPDKMEVKIDEGTVQDSEHWGGRKGWRLSTEDEGM